MIERVALAPALRVVANHDRSTGGGRLFSGVVAAVVGDDDDLELLRRVVHRLQARDGLADACAFVVGGNDEAEPSGWLRGRQRRRPG